MWRWTPSARWVTRSDMTPFPVQELKDIHPAPPPGLAWWVWLSIALAIAAIPLVLWGIRRWKRHGPYRQAKRELTFISRASAETFATDLNRWLKQTALLGWQREEIAPLHGKAWLEFLTQHGGGDFTRFAANWEAWVYGSRPVPPEQQTQLLADARTWLKNLPRKTKC